MRVGIFAKTFRRPTVEATFDAVRAHGIDCVQFNFSCAGLEPMPSVIDGDLCRRVREAAVLRGIEIAAVSGTFNMIHPEAEQRRDGLRRLRVIAETCESIGASLITLCTGTRDSQNMWRRHAGNDLPDAWSDLLTTVREAVAIASGSGVTLGVEPEVSNVVNSAKKARRLLDQIGSPHLKIVMDPANLFPAGTLARISEILDEAFQLLGRDIVLAHAKDLDRDGEAGHVPAGKGLLDYPRYLELLRRAGFDGPLILHGLEEKDVSESAAFLNAKIRAAQPEGVR